MSLCFQLLTEHGLFLQSHLQFFDERVLILWVGFEHCGRGLEALLVCQAENPMLHRGHGSLVARDGAGFVSLVERCIGRNRSLFSKQEQEALGEQGIGQAVEYFCLLRLLIHAESATRNDKIEAGKRHIREQVMRGEDERLAPGFGQGHPPILPSGAAGRQKALASSPDD
jgi:hypothetical protein